MASACWLCAYAVGLFRKGTMPSAYPDNRHFSLSQYGTGALQAATPVLWVWVGESICVCSIRGTAWDSRSFFHQLNPYCFSQPELWGTYFLGTGTLGREARCGAGPDCSWDIPPKFLSTTLGWETSMFCICALPTHLDGCGFFNSLVVRLPFNSLYDGSEWWFCILFVILMWCEGAGHVCLHSHLTRSPFLLFLFVFPYIFVFGLCLSF